MQTKFFKRGITSRISGKFTKRTFRLALAVTLVITGLTFLAIPAFALDPPDDPPTVSNLFINRNLYQAGDKLVYFNYDLPYDTTPTVGADKAFSFRLIDTDGVTELGYITPFVYNDNGYNEGIAALYFGPADTFTWDTEYTIRISQSPSYFATPENVDYTIPDTCYTDSTSQSNNRVEVTANLFAMSQDLETAFGKQLFSTDTQLSQDGEAYFRGAISGLQGMVPSLFLVQKLPSDYTQTDWGTDQFDTYADRFDGTWVGTAMDANETQFGMGGNMIMGFITGAACLMFIIFSALKFRKSEPGLVISALLLIGGVIMGWLPTAIFASIYQGMGIWSAWLFFGSKG